MSLAASYSIRRATWALTLNNYCDSSRQFNFVNLFSLAAKYFIAVLIATRSPALNRAGFSSLLTEGDEIRVESFLGQECRATSVQCQVGDLDAAFEDSERFNLFGCNTLSLQDA